MRLASDPHRRLRQLQRAACVGFWELDLQANQFTASEETYRICGLEPREGPEPPAMLRAVAHPADAARFDAALATALADPTASIDLELRVRWPNGETRWVKSAAEVLRDEHGTPVCVSGTLLEITDRKRVEHALRASQQRLQVLHRLGELIRTERRTDSILEVALRVLGEELQASRCVFCHVDADGNGLTIPSDYTNGCASIVGHARLSDFGPTALAVLSRGESLVLRDVRRELEPAEAARYLAIDVEANIACALVHGGALRALMAVHQTSPRDWTDTEISLVQEVTERCWSLIEQRGAEAKLRESETLVQIASHLAHVGGWRLSLPDLAVSWSDEVCAIHDVPLGTVLALDQAIDLYAPEFRDSVRAHVTRCMQDGTPFEFEARLISTIGVRSGCASSGRRSARPTAPSWRSTARFKTSRPNATSRISFANRKRWRRSGGSQAASRTISTTCSPWCSAARLCCCRTCRTMIRAEPRSTRFGMRASARVSSRDNCSRSVASRCCSRAPWIGTRS
ncbi:MAG TPA: PAS domain-containing protein [Polyangiales bacterium]|nr:PAS domain-containing protein [Polyangiales bacterium]